MWFFGYYLGNLKRLFAPVLPSREVALVIIVCGIGYLGYQFWTEQQINSSEAASRVISTAETKCSQWIGDEYNPNQRTDPATIYGTWEKNGSIVVEIAWPRERSSSTLNSRLCVYDPETGRMQSPGAFGRGRWERY